MTRTLHIFEAGDSAWAMGAVLGRAVGAGDRVLVLGTAQAAAQVSVLGLRADVRVAPALGCGVGAWPVVRRMISESGERFDRVHAWSVGALVAARLARVSLPMDATISMPPRGAAGDARRGGVLARLIERWGACAARGCERLVFSSAEVRDAWSAMIGVAAAEARVLSARSFGWPDIGADRTGVRESWGVQPGERVLLALADHPSLIDARRFIFHLGVMAVAGHRLVGVVPSSAAQLERAVRFTRRHHGAWRIVIDDTPGAVLMGAADAALPASVYCAWSASLARRMGVPLVEPAEANGDRLRANSALMRVLEGIGVSA